MTHAVVLAANTGDDLWVVDPDTHTIYIDHEQDAAGFAAAAETALLVLQLGPDAVPGLCKPRPRHLQLVSSSGGGTR